MFNVLLLSRIKRLIHNDPYLPVQCFSLFVSNDEICKCKNYCKYSQLNEQKTKNISNNQTSKLI